MENKSDFFFLVILIIVVSAFIGLNIVKIVDNRMKKLSINIPKITVPKSKVEISLSKEDKKLLAACGKNKKIISKKKSKKKKKSSKVVKVVKVDKKGKNFEEEFQIIKETSIPDPINFDEIMKM